MSGKQAAKEVLRDLSGGSKKDQGVKDLSIEEGVLSRSLVINDFLNNSRGLASN